MLHHHGPNVMRYTDLQVTLWDYYRFYFFYLTELHKQDMTRVLPVNTRIIGI